MVIPARVKFHITYLIDLRQVVVIHEHSNFDKDDWIVIRSRKNHGDTWIFWVRIRYFVLRYFQMWLLCEEKYEKPWWFMDTSICEDNRLNRIVFEIWKPTVIRGYFNYNDSSLPSTWSSVRYAQKSHTLSWLTKTKLRNTHYLYFWTF